MQRSNPLQNMINLLKNQGKLDTTKSTWQLRANVDTKTAQSFQQAGLATLKPVPTGENSFVNGQWLESYQEGRSYIYPTSKFYDDAVKHYAYQLKTLDSGAFSTLDNATVNPNLQVDIQSSPQMKELIIAGVFVLTSEGSEQRQCQTIKSGPNYEAMIAAMPDDKHGIHINARFRNNFVAGECFIEWSDSNSLNNGALVVRTTNNVLKKYHPSAEHPYKCSDHTGNTVLREDFVQFYYIPKIGTRESKIPRNLKQKLENAKNDGFISVNKDNLIVEGKKYYDAIKYFQQYTPYTGIVTQNNGAVTIKNPTSTELNLFSQINFIGNTQVGQMNFTPGELGGKSNFNFNISGGSIGAINTDNNKPVFGRRSYVNHFPTHSTFNNPTGDLVFFGNNDSTRQPMPPASKPQDDFFSPLNELKEIKQQYLTETIANLNNHATNNSKNVSFYRDQLISYLTTGKIPDGPDRTLPNDVFTSAFEFLSDKKHVHVFYNITNKQSTADLHNILRKQLAEELSATHDSDDKVKKNAEYIKIVYLISAFFNMSQNTQTLHTETGIEIHRNSFPKCDAGKMIELFKSLTDFELDIETLQDISSDLKRQCKEGLTKYNIRDNDLPTTISDFLSDRDEFQPSKAQPTRVQDPSAAGMGVMIRS